MDAIVDLARHVVGTRYEDIPEEAIGATKRFLFDSIGVGIAGSSGPFVRELTDVQALSWGLDKMTAAPAESGCTAIHFRLPEPRWSMAIRSTTRSSTASTSRR